MSDAFHPVQVHRPPRELPAPVTLRAYEVYCALHGPQVAMVTGGCRGGFGLHELIAYLYAHSFQREEWRARLDEAMRSRPSENNLP